MTKEFKVTITVYIEAESKEHAEDLVSEQLQLDDDTELVAVAE